MILPGDNQVFRVREGGKEGLYGGSAGYEELEWNSRMHDGSFIKLGIRLNIHACSGRSFEWNKAIDFDTYINIRENY